MFPGFQWISTVPVTSRKREAATVDPSPGDVTAGDP